MGDVSLKLADNFPFSYSSFTRARPRIHVEKPTPIPLRLDYYPISGLMSVLVASKKLKTAISTIDDYDLPEDQALEQLSSSLEEWIQQNLIVE